jgi:hypothetical protein
MESLGKPEAYRIVRRQSRCHHLPAAHCLLLTAYSVTSPSLFAKRNALASSSTDSGRFAFTVTNAATESAPVGSRDFVSWAPVGSDARDRADGIWRDLVCD